MTASVIAVVGQKGGVGKSTIARLLAVEAIKAGQAARIIDLDPAQGTTTKWKIKRDQNEFDPEIPVEKCRTVEAALRRVSEGELLILDGPGFADKLTLSMARAADLVVLPTGFGRDDLEPQIELAYDLEDRGIETSQMRFAFCRVASSKAKEDEARKYLRPTGLLPLESKIREKTSIERAHDIGLSASETGFAAVDAEAKEMARELMRLLDKETV